MNIYIWALLWLQSDLSNHLKGQLGPPVSDVTFLHIFRAAKCPVNRLSLTTIAKFTENTPLYPLQLSLARKCKRRSTPASSLRPNRLSSWAWSNLLSSAHARSAGPKGLRAESARAFTGRWNSRSGRGEDFLSRQPNFFYGNSCNSRTKSRKIVSKVGN